MSGTAFAPEIDAPVCRYVELDRAADAAQVALLSADECTRAARMRFAVDRDRFVAAHIALRLMLAEQSALHANALNLAYGQLGKPWLPERAGLHFSLSHSRALALIAVGGRGPLGVDVECLRPVPDALDLAERHFTARENRALRSMPSAQRGRAFLTCWTRKEACLKAIGLGLMLDPCEVEVGLEPTLRWVEVLVGEHVLSVTVGPAPERADSVASVAEWHVRKPLPGMPGSLAQVDQAGYDSAACHGTVDFGAREVSP